MPMKSMEKRGFSPPHAALRLGKWERGRKSRMRVMFFTWMLLIATGLAFYTVIGLAHN
jgi:hypothetical protein